jgi:hypothetical protein
MVRKDGAARWLLLIHQIPPKPSYLRVKVGRRLQALGAVAVKNSVYALPRGDQALEDLQWVRREIVADGGDASVCEAQFVEGLSDGGIEALFRAARTADYTDLAREAERLRPGGGRRPGRGRAAVPKATAAGVLRLRKRLAEIVAIDFFGAPGRDKVEGLLTAAEAALRQGLAPGRQPSGPTMRIGDVRGRTWVTRTDVHVDRIASAWLVRRFIDPRARLKFVRGQDYKPRPRELRFDMFEAELTHEGDLCTFEVIVRRFGIEDPGLRQIGEIVHDIDLKDAKFGRQDALGVDRLLAGITLSHKDDEDRIRAGGAALDALYEYFMKIAK